MTTVLRRSPTGALAQRLTDGPGNAGAAGHGSGTPPGPHADPAAVATMSFGRFPITECQHFPPDIGPRCWAYLTLNAEIALSLDGSPVLQRLIQSPRVRISVDSQWLWWALRRKYPGQPLTKMSGSDLIEVLASDCRQQGRRLLLLGSDPLHNGDAVRKLRQRWPGLQVAGYAPPAYAPDSPAEQQVFQTGLAAIRSWQPHFVVLGLGALREQRFVEQLLPQLDGLVGGVLCFGGAINLASGRERRAPVWCQRSGLEVLYRGLVRPARMGRVLRMLRILPRLVRRDY